MSREWSATVWHSVKNNKGTWKKAQTREGYFRTWEEARLWAVNFVRTNDRVTLAEVSHVEFKPGSIPRKREDVAVIKLIPSWDPVAGLFWTERRRQEPWFK